MSVENTWLIKSLSLQSNLKCLYFYSITLQFHVQWLSCLSSFSYLLFLLASCCVAKQIKELSDPAEKNLPLRLFFSFINSLMCLKKQLCHRKVGRQGGCIGGDCSQSRICAKVCTDQVPVAGRLKSWKWANLSYVEKCLFKDLLADLVFCCCY